MNNIICMAICLVPLGFLLLCFYGASQNVKRDHRIKELLLEKLEEENRAKAGNGLCDKSVYKS